MEYFASDMQNLPKVVEQRLAELRQLDNFSRSESLALQDAEVKLFDEIASLSKSDPDFDEDPVRNKYLSVLNRRHEVLNDFDMQMKKIQRLYDTVDSRIAFIGRRGFCFFFVV
jgi:hypothetical protein